MESETDPPRIQPASAAEIRDLARQDRIDLSDAQAEDLRPVIASLTDFGDLLERFEAESRLSTPEPRDPGYMPPRAENPHNAFIRRCHVEGASTGPLAGLTVGVKDNIAVAGVPMTNGSRLESYTPIHDAVVVERVLAAGGTIVGKLNMDDFGASGLGQTSAFGPVRNPVDITRTAGGSSGGSGAAVRSGAVDLSLGVDQGGSGRIPAAFCGVVAAKPTHGLVPSWGTVYVDHTIDFVTPLARTVGAVALLLEVIAGSDQRDAQWVRHCRPLEYTRRPDSGVEGMRIAVVSESTDGGLCEVAVLENMRRTVEVLREAGAEITDVSIPLWREGLSLFLPYIAHLFSDTFRGEGQGVGHLGTYDTHAMSAYAKSRRLEASLLADQVKCWLIADRYIHERYLGVPFARLHNARLTLRRSIMLALDGYDLLLTPTLPMTAPKLFAPDASFAERSALGAKLCYNTAALNLSGNPAVSIPSGVDASGLPTAVQLIAKHFDDERALTAAFTLERIMGPFVSESVGPAA